MNFVNSELALLEDPDGNGYGTVESQNRIDELEMERRRILQLREESWRLKSRAIWLQAGDENSKFFPNTIWEMKKDNDEIARSFEDLASEGVNYFKNLFKAPDEVSIAEVIRAAQIFPRFIEEEDNDSLMVPISKEEVESVLKSMQRDKSPGPDG